ncbi:MAG: class I SAM-dependent methyltransferase [Verrucomicrobiota bacterium]
MRLALVSTFLILVALTAVSLLTNKQSSPEPSPKEPPTHIVSPTPPYTYATPSRDGIGKFYLGREIAAVMGHQAIPWLERNNRELEEAPSRAIQALKIQPTDTIADIGAGSGYYSFRLSKLVPQGQVIAVDIQPEMIDFLTEKARDLNITNVHPHLGKIDSLQLPPESLDAAILVDAYHEFSHPAEMLASLHTALKPNGRLFLLEYRAEDPQVPIKPLHKMTEQQAIKELSTNNLTHITTLNHLPWQHLMIFKK